MMIGILKIPLDCSSEYLNSARPLHLLSGNHTCLPAYPFVGGPFLAELKVMLLDKKANKWLRSMNGAIFLPASL